MLRFSYESIELWKISSTTILQAGLVGLLPLVTLTKDGKQLEVLDAMLEQLVPTQDNELLTIAYTVASLVFKADADIKMLRRRFAMLGDILRDTWVYKEIMEEGLEKGLEQGLEQGLEKGLEKGLEQKRKEWLQSQHDLLLKVISARFPMLVPEAEQKVASVDDILVLQDMLIQLCTVQTSEEAQAILTRLEQQ